MSDWAQIVIQIDKFETAVRQQMADHVTGWLLNEAIVAPFDASKRGWREEFGRTGWSPGRAWREAVDEVPGAVFDTLWHNGVDISADIVYQSALGNYEPWRCPRCNAGLDEGEYADAWIASQEEPVATCASCGWAAPLGNWPGEYPAVLVGAPTVIFHNWHPLRPAFIDELKAMLGNGRCRHFAQKL